MKTYTLRYETKAWYEVNVKANSPEEAVKKLAGSTMDEFEHLTADKALEDEDLTPTDIQVVD